MIGAARVGAGSASRVDLGLREYFGGFLSPSDAGDVQEQSQVSGMIRINSACPRWPAFGEPVTSLAGHPDAVGEVRLVREFRITGSSLSRDDDRGGAINETPLSQFCISLPVCCSSWALRGYTDPTNPGSGNFLTAGSAWRSRWCRHAGWRSPAKRHRLGVGGSLGVR